MCPILFTTTLNSRNEKWGFLNQDSAAIDTTFTQGTNLPYWC